MRSLLKRSNGLFALLLFFPFGQTQADHQYVPPGSVFEIHAFTYECLITTSSQVTSISGPT